MMILIYTTWSENYGNKNQHETSSKVFLVALQSIRDSKSIANYINSIHIE